MRNLKEYTIDFFGDLIRCGGETVSEEQHQERLKICKGCDKAGKVNPLPLIWIEGCTECGCPFRTKLKTKTHCELKNGVIQKVTTTCPHPKGNKWAEVDQKFESYE